MDLKEIIECAWEGFWIALCVVGGHICVACSVVCIAFAIIGAVKWSLMWLLLLIAAPVFLFLFAIIHEIMDRI